MTNFITIEDVNASLLKYGTVNTFHCIDTSKILSEGYDRLVFDFCIISHSVSQNTHTFEIKVKNSLWNGGYYYTDSQDEYIDADASYSDDTITITTSESNIKIYLYLTNLTDNFQFKRYTWTSNDLFNVNSFFVYDNTYKFTINKLKSIQSDSVTFKYQTITATSTIDENNQVEYVLIDENTEFDGIIEVTYDNCTYFIQSKKIKNIIPFIIEDTVYTSKLNTVQMNVLDLGEAIGTGTITFKNQKWDVDFSETRSFELDLRNKTDDSDIQLQIHLDETDLTLAYDYDVRLNCEILSVSDFETLKTELQTEDGCRIFNLDTDIVCDSDILISHDVKINAMNHIINLDSHSLKMQEDVTVIVENLTLENGNPCWIQSLNSKLDLQNCVFRNCSATEFNNLGSVVFCDIDLESLLVESDFITNISDSLFENNHNCIFSGGDVSIDNCTYINNDVRFADKNNSAFLYQVDGEARITNSTFDINYDTDAICEQQETIGFAQAVFKIGRDAIINNETYESLSRNDAISFCDTPYLNRSHLFAKYYYPQIETCVYSSPTLNKEDKCLCWCLSGEDYVFKQNIQVTRADSESENRITKLDGD